MIRFETFLKLKGLFKSFKQQYIVKPKRYRKTKPKIRKNIIKQNHTRAYEPSNISYAYDSLFWRWRRVAEWERYINDPYDNIKIKGHMITRIC